MDRIPSPYNFVPAAPVIHLGAEDVSHDHPYEDGISGTLDIAVTNETPLFIRGTSASNRSYTVGAEGGEFWAIPGSSVRGLIRSVVEIASFSRLGPINDVRYGYRDLNNKDRGFYSGHMAGIHNGQPIPKVSACWLTKKPGTNTAAAVTHDNADEVVATLDVVNWAKVEDGFLQPLAKDFDLLRKNSAPMRYRGLGLTPGKTESFDVPLDPTVVRRDGATVEGYTCVGEVKRAVRGGIKQKGHVVITGQPTDKRPDAPKKFGAGNPKHHDFFFYGNTITTVEVSRKAFREFEFIHGAENDSRHGQRLSRNTEWDFLGAEFDKGKPVPVFALFKQGAGPKRELRSFGLCTMFRLAYEHSTKTLLKNTQKDDKPTRWDFAQALFGTVPLGRRAAGTSEPEGPQALKGRVSFDTLIGPTVKAAPPLNEVQAVFGAPKPSFYPNYVEQRPEPEKFGEAPASGYKTYNDGSARLRGWKRYRLQDPVPRPELPQEVKEHQKSKFCPIPAGQSFTGKLRFHNLRPHELGALLWALDFGGDSSCRHALGLAKPYGYGRVAIAVFDQAVFPNAADLDAPVLTGDKGRQILKDARAAFEAHMNGIGLATRWEDTPQVKNLRAIARPVPGNPLDLRYPTIKPNQFADAKKGNLVLVPLVPSAAMDTGPRGAPPSQANAVSAPASPEALIEGFVKEIRKAQVNGAHFALVASWAAQAPGTEASQAERKAAARRGLGVLKEAQRAKYADIVSWLEG